MTINHCQSHNTFHPACAGCIVAKRNSETEPQSKQSKETPEPKVDKKEETEG